MQRRFRPVTKRSIIILLVLIIAAAVAVYFYTHKKSGSSSKSTGSSIRVSGSTSKPAPNQLPTNTSSSTGQGGVTDSKGQTTGSLPPPSQWTSSASGNITLQLPSPNQVLQPGDSLVGLAKVSTVQFILKDDAVGLIAQGGLNVANGKFSGVLHFTPHSKSGKLEVYYPNPNNGAEEDIVEVNVSYNQ